MKRSLSRWLSIAALSVVAATGYSYPAMAAAAPADAAKAPSATVKLVVQHSGKCVTDGFAYNTPATQYACGVERDYAQRWTFKEVHPGYYQIMGSSSLCLTAPIYQGRAASMLLCSPYPETVNQHFMLRYHSLGWYQLISEYSGQCLAVPGHSPLDGTSLIQTPCRTTNNANQLFNFSTV